MNVDKWNHLLTKSEQHIPENVFKTISFFEKNKLWYKLSRNLNASTCADAARKRFRNEKTGIPLEDELKTYFGEYSLDNGKKQFLLINLPGNNRIDFNKIRVRLGVLENISLCGEQTMGMLNIEFGSVNPFLIHEIFFIVFANNIAYRNLLCIFSDELIYKKNTTMTNAGSLTWGIEFKAQEVIHQFSNVIYSHSIIETPKKNLIDYI